MHTEPDETRCRGTASQHPELVGSTEIFASNSEKIGSGHGSHVAASAMGGRGHGGHVTNLPISETRNCTSLKAGHDNRVSYAFLHRF